MGRKKGGEEKKAMVALLNFLMATLEIVFGRKKLLDGKGPFDDNAVQKSGHTSSTTHAL